MPEFILDTSGAVQCDERTRFENTKWRDLDAFTQGYIEALFFTSCAAGYAMQTVRASLAAYESMIEDGGTVPEDAGFADLAPEALATILQDCQSFKLACVHVQPLMGEGDMPDEAQAGRDFWYTRNGHGCGFWDGDWPEPWADDLDKAAKAFGEVDAYLGDDGKVYVS